MDTTLTVDTSPFSQIDRRFLHVLFGSLLVHLTVAVWVNRQPHVASEDPYERAPDRFSRAPLLPIPKVFPPVKRQPPSSSPVPPGRRPSSPGPGRSSPNLTGLLAAAVSDLNRGSGDTEAALFGAKQGPVDTSVLASRRERGPSEAQSVGPIVTNGARDVRIGEHADVVVPRGKVQDIELDEPDEVPDASALLRFIRSRSAALTSCYERELKHNPTLKGRVTVHLTVTADGRAREVAVSADSLRSAEVAGCLEGVIRRWIFPVKPGDEVPLTFPVLFTPTGG
ncbi:MAG: AgmX/PglI C-terminal domain-containing protein [Myxococcaceae bacterium]|nr:AgmX/PglI C-terminal domain-containing protein [Myxococcaceae bacterium]